MAKAVPFKLVTPERVVFDGEAELVIAVTTEGEEGILPKHAPFLGALKPGVLRANVLRQAQDRQAQDRQAQDRQAQDGHAQDAEGASSRLELATSEGFMQALPDRVTVLVDEALAFGDVEVARARERLQEATERQKSVAVGTDAYKREQAIIDFANAQLRLTGQR